MKAVLYGTADSEPQTELVAQLAQETYNSGLIPMLIMNLAKFDFEVSKKGTIFCYILCNSLIFQSKKDVALIFNNLLRRQIGTRSPTVEYLCGKPEILITLLRG